MCIRDSRRGDLFDQLVMEFNLQIHNNSHTPTYSRYNAESCIDVVMSRDLPWEVEGWTVLTEHNGSDHRTVTFSMTAESLVDPPSRSWGCVDWPAFTSFLASRSPYLPPNLDQRKLDKLLSKFYYDINLALDKCSKKNSPRRRKNNLWYTDELAGMAKGVANLYKKFRRNTSYRERYRTALKNYRKGIKKARLDSWRKYQESIDSIAKASKYSKVLNSKGRTKLSCLRTANGTLTDPGADTLQRLMEVHFPSSADKQKTSIQNLVKQYIKKPINYLDLVYPH